jgi:hypothetical protein
MTVQKPNIYIVLIMIIMLVSCKHNAKTSDVNILFLHHSTGERIWGTRNTLIYKIARKFNDRLADKIGNKAQLPLLFEKYNEEKGKSYHITKMAFPKSKPYGWHNYPYDYYNIWVKNAGEEPYMKEPTLEILSKQYQVIIFKHCFPVSNILSDDDSSDINSFNKTLGNYRLQYLALRDKLHSFPDTKFILFTGAAQVQAHITLDQSQRAKEFFEWVKKDWDLPDDNIYLWDLYKLQTEEGLYFKEVFATSPNDSHPNKEFSEKAANLLFKRIIDVIENKGLRTKLTGEAI